jgi:hypothetical protein
MNVVEQEDGSVVASCLCLKFRMVARTTAVLYDKALQPAGLSSSQFSALRNIYRFVPLGISQLAKVMLLERTTLTRNHRRPTPASSRRSSRRAGSRR